LPPGLKDHRWNVLVSRERESTRGASSRKEEGKSSIHLSPPPFARGTKEPGGERSRKARLALNQTASIRCHSCTEKRSNDKNQRYGGENSGHERLCSPESPVGCWGSARDPRREKRNASAGSAYGEIDSTNGFPGEGAADMKLIRKKTLHAGEKMSAGDK